MIEIAKQRLLNKDGPANLFIERLRQIMIVLKQKCYQIFIAFTTCLSFQCILMSVTDTE